MRKRKGMRRAVAAQRPVFWKGLGYSGRVIRAMYKGIVGFNPRSKLLDAVAILRKIPLSRPLCSFPITVKKNRMGCENRNSREMF
jgi:hypothetical protein